MKATNVRYERVINLGNYESERIALEVALDDAADTPEDALLFARRFVANSASDPLARQHLQAQLDEQIAPNDTDGKAASVPF